MKLGQTINHPTFGSGTVLGLTNGGNMRVQFAEGVRVISVALFRDEVPTCYFPAKTEAIHRERLKAWTHPLTRSVM